MDDAKTPILRYTLGKAERLSSRSKIKELFLNGSSFRLYPLRLIFLKRKSEAPAQLVFSVPKRLFKRAVDRNKLKRRLKEAYRLQKHILPATTHSESFLLAIVYTGKEKKEYSFIADKLKTLLQRLSNEAANSQLK